MSDGRRIVDRLAALRKRLEEKDLPAIIVTQMQNWFYLSGFTGDAGALLITANENLLLTDFRYTEQAAGESPEYEIVRISSVAENLPDLAKRLSLTRLGFESRVVTVAEHASWSKALSGVELVPTEGIVEGLRAVKDAGELGTIREAATLTDRAYHHLLEWVRPGVTEKAAVLEAEVFVRSHGGDGLAFMHFATGPNGSMPHAVPGDRTVRPHEPVIVDLGARVGGYCADLTRTFCVGEPDPQLARIHGIVLEAQLAAEKAIKAGVEGKAMDAVARQVITDAGYGAEFGHSLGHGVGLQVHELPRLSRVSTDMLVPNQVVTVEPGIYIPGWGGVRIEDLAVVTETGIEVLSKATKEMVAPGR
jgi:Xaa-Pro aminopeptidase